MGKPELVGILNITPDSFSDGGVFVHVQIDGTEIVDTPKALDAAHQLFADGARYLDIGGESTRPGATALTPDQEWARIGTVLMELIPAYPGRISVDSYHPETHKRLLAAHLGAFIINDVTGFNNPDMIAVAGKSKMTSIISHLPASYGTDIQAAHHAIAPMNDMKKLATELLIRQQQLTRAGVPKNKIILDPGIGFGKTKELNAQLLEFAAYIKRLDPTARVMIGYSRKRFLGDDRMELEPNLAAGRIAIASGADYLRVHDVAGHVPLLKRN